nr:reverse transcriptase domain-containing protein [Tanacetum cinerariifolium]
MEENRVIVKGTACDLVRIAARVKRKLGKRVAIISPVPIKKQEKKEELPKVTETVLKMHMHCEGCAEDVRHRLQKMKGQIQLLVIVGNEEHSTRTWMTFMVIRSPSPYNGIIGRPGISAIRAVQSTAHGMLKLTVDGGIVTIYNTTVLPRECNTVACREAMCALLQRNLNIFTWEPKHMNGVPRSITEHKPEIRQGYSPVRQKKQLCDNPFKDCLGEGIKARLDKHKGRWVEELSPVLWAHRTTIKVSTGDTPFSLVYGTEAVIPAEIGMPTIRTVKVNVATNDDERRIDLDLLEERRERAAICEAKAKSKMKGYYDAKVRGVSFRPGDFVYHANGASHAEDAGKLGPKWERPYEVTKALGNGAYKLRDMDG